MDIENLGKLGESLCYKVSDGQVTGLKPLGYLLIFTIAISPLGLVFNFFKSLRWRKYEK